MAQASTTLTDVDAAAETAVPSGLGGAEPLELATAALALATVDPERAVAASELALGVARRGRDRRAASLALRARGVAELQLRHLDDAVASLRSAVAAARRAGDLELVGQANMSLGPALMLRGQTAQGLAAVGRAIAGLQGVLAARARVQRSAMLQQLGRYTDSLDDARVALPVLRRSADHEWEIRALSNRSNVYVARRQLGLAEADLVRTQRLCDAEGLPLAGAYALQNLGCVHAARGDIPSALACFDQAADRYALLGLVVGSLLVDRATALLSVRLLEEARDSAEAAVATLEAQHRTIELPDAQLILSTTALLQGDVDVAADAAAAATAALRRLGRTEWLPLARYAWLQAQLAPQLTDHHASAPTDRPTVPSSRVRATAEQLEVAGWTVPALEARILAARMALDEGRRTTARRDLALAARARRAGPADARARAWFAEAMFRDADGARGGAKRALRAAVRVLDEHRLSLGAAELRAHVSVHRGAACEAGLRFALQEHDGAGVHWWGEKRRASADVVRSALPPADPTLAGLLADLRGTMTEIAKTRGEGKPGQSLVARQVQLEQSIRDFARRHPTVVAQPTPPPRLGELAGDLGDTALVEIVDNGTDLFALTLVGGRSRLRPLDSLAEIRHALQHLPFALRRMVQPHGSRPADTAIAVVEHAVEVLQRRLLQPIERTVGDRPLLVVPPGWLQGLPWSLLPACHGRAVSVAPSATLWRTARNRPRHDDGSVVAIAGPELPGAVLEAREVAALYPDAILMEGSDAVADRVGAVIGSAATCHIAAHGTVRPDNPLFSSLLLDDGPFTVFDLEQLGATPRQVVLAACESGVSKVTPGQEILGLTAALLSRQTATVVAPVIAIDDAETTPLMVGYHRRLRSGRSPAEALAEVQAERRDGDWRSRATAAAFLCLGVGDQPPAG
ncbi:MAG TPA: CHAT domain-containing protein [Microlunatus sp.]|nr:CHAT domain-containing protein [Microlunatus sp.]